jgi:acetyl/propionyl-CoA carboxylase alpha subunit
VTEPHLPAGKRVRVTPDQVDDPGAEHVVVGEWEGRIEWGMGDLVRARLADGTGRHGRVRRVSSAPGSPLEVEIDGWRFVLAVEDAERAELRERAGGGAGTASATGPTELRTPIPGRVVSVSAAVGEQVEAGQPLLVVEAMKMQNEVRAPRAGVVRRIDVAGGQSVDAGDLLLVLE